MLATSATWKKDDLEIQQETMQRVETCGCNIYLVYQEFFFPKINTQHSSAKDYLDSSGQ